MSILITGATGQLGSLVLASVLKTTSPGLVHVACRDTSKLPSSLPKAVHRHQADFGDVASIEAAMAGIEKVLLISTDFPGTRYQMHKNVIDVAKKAGVKLLAYTSILHGTENSMKLADEHKATEEYINASGIPFVMLRNGWYFQNYTNNYGAWMQHGAIVGASENGRISAAARQDYADAAAAVLTGTGHAGNIYELAGDSSFTGEELAAEVTRQCGKQIVWKSIPTEEYAKMLAGFGLPQVIADILADADLKAASNALEDKSMTLSKLIGRKTTTLKQMLEQVAKK